jgi:hypothetical protein
MKRKKYTYIPKDEIESITTWSGKNITQEKILDGAYVRGNVKYAKGGMAHGVTICLVTKEMYGIILHILQSQVIVQLYVILQC